MTAKRPTILHVLHTMRTGGAEMLVRDMLESQSGQYNFAIAALDEGGNLEEQYQALGASTYTLDRKPGRDWSIVDKLGEILVKHEVDIIHAHQSTPWFYAAKSLKKHPRSKLIFHEHGRHYPDTTTWKRRLYNKLFITPNTDVFLAVGHYIKAQTAIMEGISPSKIQVIHNGITFDHFLLNDTATRQRKREELGITDDQPLILHVGRFSEVKDHATSLRAIAAVSQKHPNAICLYAGNF